MAKKSIIAREEKRAKIVKKYSAKRLSLKEAASNLSLSYEDRMEAMEKLSKLPRDASPVRRQSRCRITGRPHAVYRKFGLSRIKLRELAMQGDVPGLRKASW